MIDTSKKVLKLNIIVLVILSVSWPIFLPAPLWCYPVDGYEYCGIRRLERLKMILEGRFKGTAPVAGARKSINEIKLNLVDPPAQAAAELMKPDLSLQKGIEALFPDRHESYSLALLDITSGRPTRFASWQGERRFSPGSVGKLAIAAGLFRELQRLYPDHPEKRRELLRKRMIAAGKWIHTDHHDVPIFNPDDGSFVSRPIVEGDVFSLFEWADHMLSASANSAGSTVWKELILMRAFGDRYPPSEQEEKSFFEKTPKTELRDMAMSVVNDPLRDMGIVQQEWQLGSFFTSTGKKIVPSGGSSYGNPIALLKFLVVLEQGRVVDNWSSLEIKRLMYMTAKRIRYASSPALNNAAVYYKSGSLYRCKPEPDFKCGKYKGNVENVMNSVAVVEHPDGRVYLVALMSDVLRKNSAVEHQTLGTFIDRVLRK